MRVRLLASLAVGLTIVVSSGSVRAGGWPQWGGPSRDFVVPSPRRLAASWPSGGPRVVYERELGGGYSAVLVAGDRLYVGFHDGDTEVVAGLDAADGATRWRRVIRSHYLESHVLQFGVGPNATPLLLGDRLFAVSFGGSAYALDAADGTVLWQRDLGKAYDAKPPQFGYSAAPLAVRHPTKGQLLVLAIGGKRFGAVGLRPGDGELLWQTPPFGASYAPPVELELAGERQIVFMAPTEVVGVRLDDGAVRWRHRHANRFRVNCVSPLWNPRDRTLFITSQADAGSRLLRLSRAGGQVAVEELMATAKIKVSHGNLVRLGDTVYVPGEPFFVAFDTVRQRILWQMRGYSEGRFTVVGDQAFVLDEHGVLSLVELSPRGMKVTARAQVLSKPAWTPPTFADGRLFLRDTKKLVVLDVGTGSPR